jgi:hypothetical protein
MHSELDNREKKFLKYFENYFAIFEDGVRKFVG